MKTCLPGHAAPLFAIEVASTTNPNKDYAIAPEKDAALARIAELEAELRRR